MTDDFHNPYNFIPVTGKVKHNKDTQVAYDDIAAANTHIRHDIWQAGKHSGRLLVRLQLKTPTVVGGQHEERENETTLVKPYEREGNIAIPGNSLRGMIGSVAETLSQSALRVLEKRSYSVRKPVDQGLSAVGMLRKGKGETEFELQPLSLPLGDSYFTKPIWQRIFDERRIKDYLPAYVDGYEKNTCRNPPEPKLTEDSFLETHPNNATFLGRRTDTYVPKFHYARLNQDETKIGRFLTAHKIHKNNNVDDIITAGEFAALTLNQKQHYTPGMLRILGIEGRELHIPFTKSHELFIPALKALPNLPVPDEVVACFRTIAKERNEETKEQHKKDPRKTPLLPFALKGYNSWELESGQLVFFDIEENNGKIEVSEISFSAIWRKPVEGDSHDFFQKIDANLRNPSNLLPWNPSRNNLTPAECLFGVVESEKRADAKQALALASRVRFSDGIALAKVNTHPEVTLKILSSPKPPSPAMYFHPEGKSKVTNSKERYVSKTNLNTIQHRPNGRKVYLHHHPDAVNKAFWKTQKPSEDKQQKMACQPMEAGQSFYFHIDFDNLSTAELSLLIHSIAPSEQFQHRLGLGKPLGLGSVKLDIIGLFLIDRQQRYSLDGFYETSRYHQVLQGSQTDDAWQTLYPLEYQAWQQIEKTTLADSTICQNAELIDGITLDLLNTVGDPSKLKPNTPVEPPMTLQQNDPEQETFKWFVENDKELKNSPSYLEALPPIESNRELPVLPRLKERTR